MKSAELAEALRALAVPSRLKIIELLQLHPHCVRALTMRLDISQPAVSQHLAVLKDKGIGISEIKGNKRIYSIVDPFVREIVRGLGTVKETVGV